MSKASDESLGILHSWLLKMNVRVRPHENFNFLNSGKIGLFVLLNSSDIISWLNSKLMGNLLSMVLRQFEKLGRESAQSNLRSHSRLKAEASCLTSTRRAFSFNHVTARSRPPNSKSFLNSLMSGNWDIVSYRKSKLPSWAPASASLDSNLS